MTKYFNSVFYDCNIKKQKISRACLKSFKNHEVFWLYVNIGICVLIIVIIAVFLSVHDACVRCNVCLWWVCANCDNFRMFCVCALDCVCPWLCVLLIVCALDCVCPWLCLPLIVCALDCVCPCCVWFLCVIFVCDFCVCFGVCGVLVSWCVFVASC
jgi:hypothetical protein